MKQKYTNQGYTIVEALTYITIVIIVAYSTSHTMIFVSQSLQREQQKVKHLYQQLMALDLITFDIWHAPSSVEQWYQLASSEIIWHMPTYDIGWCIKNNKLIRRKGTFDNTLRTWITRKSSVVCNNINHLKFEHTVTHDHVQSIHVMLISKDSINDVQRMVYLRNRVIYEN